MSGYGKASVRAVHLFTTGHAESPKEAWSIAVGEVFGVNTSSAQKGCPRDAFLGLCTEGLIKGIPRGQYTRSQKNKRYAIEAVTVLRQNPALADNPDMLWKAVMGGEKKAHNAQMDVVIALWKEGLIA